MELNTTNSTSVNTAEAPPTLKHGAKAAFLYYIYLTRGVLAISMAVITSFSNGLVIFLVLRDPKKNLRSSPTCLLVASLALVDLAVGCGLEPTDALYSLAIANRKKPSLDRKDLQSAAAFLLLSSTVLVMLITFDRHTAVSRPIQYPYSITKKRITISVVLVWVYCAILIVAIRRWGKELRNNSFLCSYRLGFVPYHWPFLQDCLRATTTNKHVKTSKCELERYFCGSSIGSWTEGNAHTRYYARGIPILYHALVYHDADLWLLPNLPEILVDHEAPVYSLRSELRYQPVLVHIPSAALQSGAAIDSDAVGVFTRDLSIFAASQACVCTQAKTLE